MIVKLRQHQYQMNQCIDGIINSTEIYKYIKTIIVSSCPASGKGSIPVNAGKLIMAGLADAIVITVPRESLQTQTEEVFQDPFFKKLFGVNLQVRASTNDRNPCRGMNGFVTTIQALGHDKNRRVLEFMKRKRCILVNDEFHHQAVDTPWHDAMKELIEAAKYVILTSGTLSRSDRKKIAFVDYKDGYVNLVGNKNTHVIKYTRSDALQEQAILPLSFYLYDSSVEFEEFTGQIKSYDSLSDSKDKDLSKSLYTALETGFAYKLIEESISNWLEYRSKKPRSKMLFVCARIGDARRCVEYLETLNVPALLATSHGDSRKTQENIAKFKAQSPVLVTISMCYEGMDVPAVTHICILTRIRSNEWLEQAVSRATRVDKLAGPYRDQLAHIFAPKDKRFLEFVEVIENEQKTRVSCPHEKEEQLPLFQLNECGEGGLEQGPCKPLRSQILEMSKKVLGNKFIYEPPPPQTPKQEELSVRRDIDKYLKRYAYEQGFEYPAVMREAKSIDETPRAEMTIKQLKYFFNRVQKMFPMVYDSSVSKPFRLNEENFF